MAASSGTMAAPPASRTVAPAHRVAGDLTVPGDKSISHRAALFNAVADGESTIENYAPGDDCATTLDCLAHLGVSVHRAGDHVRVQGVGLGGLREPGDVLDCGNSGTTTRLLAGLLAGRDLFVVLSGDSSLRRRPMARVVEPLTAMGARIAGRDGDRLLPLAIAPAGRLHGGQHSLAVASAQVKSAILLAGLTADGPVEVVEPAPSRDHTERLLRAMGARVESGAGGTVRLEPVQRLTATDVPVPGDFSSAAFWLALACIHPDAEIRVRDVGLNPSRTGFLTILERMGADVRVERPRELAGEPVADLVARTSHLRGTTVDGDLIALAIDEVPLVALLGLFAEGETLVRDAAELRVKETDRIQAIADGLGALGGNVEAREDGWLIRPSRLRPGLADARGDHRMAMLFALAGAAGAGAEIEGADVVSVSYPAFWDHLAEIAA